MSSHGNLQGIKPAEFTRGGQKLSGTLAARELPRLREQLAGQGVSGQGGQVHYEVTGVLTDRGHDCFVLHVRGMVELSCQRCLEPVQVGFESHRRIIFAAEADSADAEDEADDADVLEPQDTVDGAVLIEDEVLLSLPMAPMHPVGSCQIAKPGDDAGAEAVSPFASLAQLAQKVRKSGD